MNTLATPATSIKSAPRETTMITIDRSPPKNIEIYATLPKNKKGLLSRASKVKNTVEDEEYLMYDRPGRTLNSSRSKLNGKKEGEKRARSEERNNNKTSKEKEFVSNSLSKEAKKQAKSEEPKQNKKQHKIRRKLLMGGLIKRKNRSMPDLREDESAPKEISKNDQSSFAKDDSSVGSKIDKQTGLSGYLSEGHLEFSGNPNLERSKLMRKSFHGSKVLQMAKVPPPPPLRTTSQLSKTERPPFPLPMDDRKRNSIGDTIDEWSPQSLPFIPASYSVSNNIESVTYANGGFLIPGHKQNTTVITTAQVHQEQSPQTPRDVVDSGSPCDTNEFPLPPYPSPLHSASHSRQVSEDFPPPPPPEVVIQDCDNTPLRPPSPQSLLAQVQQKRLQILAENEAKAAAAAEAYEAARAVGGETWLRELQAKQAALKGKCSFPQSKNETGNRTAASSRSFESIQEYESKDRLTPPFNESVASNQHSSNVKDLKSRFEQIQLEEVSTQPVLKKPPRASPVMDTSDLYDAQVNNNTIINSLLYDSSLISAHINGFDISQESNSKIIKDNNLGQVKANFSTKQHFVDTQEAKRKSGKKKNVTFCEQVVLVATADEDEVDSYIPNPILERVLRSVLHKDIPQEVKETTIQSVIPLKRTDSDNYSKKNHNEHFNNNKSNSLERSSVTNPEHYQSSSFPNLSISLNDSKSSHFTSSNGDISYQEHQQRYCNGLQHSVRTAQHTPVLPRHGLNQSQTTKQMGLLQQSNNNVPPTQNSMETNNNYFAHPLQINQQMHNVIHNQNSPTPQTHPLQLQLSQHQHLPSQYSSQASHHLHGPAYSPNNHIHPSDIAPPDNHNPLTTDYTSGQQIANSPVVTYQPVHNPQHSETNSPYQYVPLPQNHVISNSPYQHIPQTASNHFALRSGIPVSQALTSQVQSAQQSPMMNRQLSHLQISGSHNIEGRKINTNSNSVMNGQNRVNESPNQCQGDNRYTDTLSSHYSQQNVTGTLRSQQIISGEQYRAVNSLPVHQHTTVRARPQAMYQQDLAPPEYQHPPPPKKDSSSANVTQLRSDTYQRIPNMVGNSVDPSSTTSMNGYKNQGFGSQRPMSPATHNQDNSYFQHLPQQQQNGKTVYHTLQPGNQQPLQHHYQQQVIFNHSQTTNLLGHHQQQSQTNSTAGHGPNHLQKTGHNHQMTPQAQQATSTRSVYQPPPHPKHLEAANKLSERAVQLVGLSHLRSNPCNLCRKKQVLHPATYCTDCDFYMSRFKPKT